jgi:hypothetical protein
MDRRSFVLHGKRNVGYVVVIQEDIMEAKPLSGRISALMTEIYLLKICLPSATCPCMYMKGKGTSLRKAIPNKAWKRNHPSTGKYSHI